jgi:uncharacterized damage-inducible protein DinB
MSSPPDLRESVLAAWRTSNRVTCFLIEHLPRDLWTAEVPGTPRRTIRMICAHLHNSRRAWIRTLGAPHGVPVPTAVDRFRVTARQLLPALRRSSEGMAGLLHLGFEHGGTIPPTRAYVWRNLSLDVGHVLGYFIAHEGHHRGQIVLVARALGHRLPREVTDKLWQWNGRL